MESGDPALLGGCRVVGRIGEGGQGVVYLGETGSGDLVAIKLFHARFGQDRAARDDFVREAEVAKRVARFCTAQVLDVGMFGKRAYIVSEYVPGPSLQQVVTAEGPRSGSALERLAIGTATALVALHDAGVVHRDLKPQNVLIGPDGPRVIDFGIARALAGTGTVTSGIVGTPAYMAPEQLTAGELGLALDVFAWASTMTFAATGRPPFGDDAIPAVINRILNQDPVLDGVEESLRGLLAACLAKDPSRRPSAQQILDRLVRGGDRAPAALSSDPPVRAVVPGLPGGGAAPRPPAPAGEADASNRETAPGAVDGAPAPGAPRRRRGMWAAAVSVVVASVTAGGVAVGVAMLPDRDASALRSGTAPTSQVPAATVSPTARPSKGGAGQGSPSPGGKATARTVSPAAPRVSPTSAPRARNRPEAEPTPDRPTGAPSRSARPGPTASESFAADPASPTRPSPSPTPSPTRTAELGPGHFTAYCVTLGWEWVEYRETPQPGAYCVKRAGGQTMYLTKDQRDAGCRWRFRQPAAFHRFKGKSNYCYVLR
ncbi:serine/threonine protein kinase [Streptosporangium fragile]|uniref:serine/threonine protein kinase n=1 Tax=Streptosporangium fragile TaxID=46186 RepID=UPI0031E6707E